MIRLSQRTGSHMTTFVGLEWGFRHGGLAGNFGLSLAGGGVDINVADWFAYGIAREFPNGSGRWNQCEQPSVGTGPVFRIREVPAG